MPEPNEQKPVESPPQQHELPKNGAEWDKLQQDDPARWMKLTKERFDLTFRQKREAEEKLVAMQEREKNLLAQIESTKKPTPAQVIDELPPAPPQYGDGKYPQSEEEWNDLFLERPAFAADLRYEFLNQRRAQITEVQSTRQRAVENLVSEHPDMYNFEIDNETGKPKLDSQGKPVVAKDPTTGGYSFNSNSEKGKLWIDIFNEDPQGWSSLKNAPQLMMAEMERRLRLKGASMVKGQNNVTDSDQSGVAPEGVPPPKTASVKFDSAEEEAHAKRAVSRGTYKSLEEYVKLRDMESSGYSEPNRRPDFSKK